ncbi:MAG TPA: glycosyltransferase family 39 protein [Frankiaceae bacterium]|nr:glycosyltransferase family 39 protein [Frankiaceae bacterium]
MADIRTGRPAVSTADSGAVDQPGDAPAGRRRWRRPAGPALVVAVAAVLSAAVAVLLSVLMFPHLSINNDEPVYRLQAQALAAGHLFPPAPAHPDSFTPWLAVVRDGHYVLKYTPVVPGIHALSLAATGSFAAGLALLAAAGVVVTYLLGCELLGDRRVAALAAVLWALSPLTIVQSALVLPYLPFVVLLMLTVLGVVRGLRLSRGLPLAGAGLALGLAVAARPFDALMFLLPLAVWLVWTERRRLTWAVPRLALGLALPAIGLLAFDTAATGKPLSLPFALLEPNDKLGFGSRRLYPSDRPHSFGILEGLLGVGDHLWLLGIGWAAGGVLLAGLAVAAVVRRRVERPVALLGAGALLLLVGYLGFWGAWNAAELWGGTRYVGPFYVMAVLVPLVLLGARGLADLFAARRRLARAGGVLVSVLGVVLIATTLLTALPADATMSGHDRRLEDLVQAQGRSLIFIPTNPQFLQHPSAVLDNGLTPGGRTLFALTRGTDDFAVVDAEPGRSLLRLRVLGLYNKGPKVRYVTWLERMREVRGPSVPLTMQARPPAWVTSFRVIFTVGQRRLSWQLDPTRLSQLELRMTPNGPELPGQGPPLVETGPVADQAIKRDIESAAPGALTVTLLGQRGTGREAPVESDRIAYRQEGSDVAVLAPDGLVARQGRLDDPALQIRTAAP